MSLGWQMLNRCRPDGDWMSCEDCGAQLDYQAGSRLARCVKVHLCVRCEAEKAVGAAMAAAKAEIDGEPK